MRLDLIILYGAPLQPVFFCCRTQLQATGDSITASLTRPITPLPAFPQTPPIQGLGVDPPDPRRLFPPSQGPSQPQGEEAPALSGTLAGPPTLQQGREVFPLPEEGQALEPLAFRLTVVVRPLVLLAFRLLAVVRPLGLLAFRLLAVVRPLGLLAFRLLAVVLRLHALA